MAAPSRERCLLLLALDKEKMGRQCGSGCCFTDASAGRKIPFCLWKKSEMLDLEASLSISHYPNHFVSYPKYLSSQICKGEAMHLPSVKAGSNRQLAYLKSVFIYCLSSGVAARSKSRCSSFYHIVSRSDTMKRSRKMLTVSKTMKQKRAEDLEFRRYSYFGKANVTAQSVILAIAHNVNKLHNKIQSERTGNHLFELKEMV